MEVSWSEFDVWMRKICSCSFMQGWSSQSMCCTNILTNKNPDTFFTFVELWQVSWSVYVERVCPYWCSLSNKSFVLLQVGRRGVLRDSPSLGTVWLFRDWVDVLNLQLCFSLILCWFDLCRALIWMKMKTNVAMLEISPDLRVYSGNARNSEIRKSDVTVWWRLRLCQAWPSVTALCRFRQHCAVVLLFQILQSMLAIPGIL